MSAVIRIILVCMAVALSLTGRAAAQTAYAGGAPLVLSIPVTAAVTSRCGFADGLAPSGTYYQDNFDKQGLSRDFGFTLNCTSAARVAVTSANGALVGSGTSASGYATRAPYDVTLRLVANDGSQAQATCAAATLTTGSTCAFAGAASASTGLRLATASTYQTGSYLRVSAPAYADAVLVAGLYSDTLTVTVSPSL